MSVPSTINNPGETEVLADLRAAKKYATNPLLVPTEVKSRRKTTRVLDRRFAVDSVSGEKLGDTALVSTRFVDEAEFVKLFDAGIRSAFDLSHSGYKVFQLVLKFVSAGHMQDDFITLHVSFATDPKSPLKMNEKTYWRGMKELISKHFIAVSTIPARYWINPHLFFKGDRLLVVNDYVRQKDAKTVEQPALKTPAPPPSLF